MNKFALLGTSGFVAPRHLKAIKDNNCELLTSMDVSDSVGVLDSYFPESEFFTSFEKFDRHIDALRREGRAIDYLTVASPNHLHDAHIRYGLRVGANVICEKPMVLAPEDLHSIAVMEQETNRRAYCILQLRLLPAIKEIRDRLAAQLNKSDELIDVCLTYITARGKWYSASWKGDENKSGGIAMNIGVHLFDLLTYLFGEAQEIAVSHNDADTMAGLIMFRNARVRWLLSVDASLLPSADGGSRGVSYRNLRVGDDDIEFSSGFTDLHSKSYTQILEGNGFGIADVLPSLELVKRIQTSECMSLSASDMHPFLGV